MKTRFLRANDKPHIMTRARLKNIANSTKLPEDVLRFKAQRNRVVRLNKKATTTYFRDSTSGESSGKSFWDTCKLFFSEKGADSKSRIILVDHNEIVSGDQEIATVFNSYFSTITSSLPISRWNLDFIPSSDDPVINALNKVQGPS